tara:strand:+ start:639 stop:1088 length:450 start_codon:yes stop_codon:yes gene_type:complete
MKRRDFLETSTKIICACAAGSSLALVQSCTSNVATSPDPNEESEELIIDLLTDGFTALLEQGGSVVTDGNIIDSQGLLLYRTGNEVRAFRNNCTHSGWDLLPFVNGVSVCFSGHGGRFDTNGKAIASPASGTLRQYDTVLDGNSLTIYS